MKMIWFIKGVATPEQKQLAKENGFVIRNASAVVDGDFLEQCDAVCGDIPEQYKEVEQVDCPKQSIAKPEGPTKKQIQAKLTELGVEFDASLNKDDLLALLQEKTK